MYHLPLVLPGVIGATVFEFDKFDDWGDCNGTAVSAELGASVPVGEANDGVFAAIEKITRDCSLGPNRTEAANDRLSWHILGVTLVVTPEVSIGCGTGWICNCGGSDANGIDNVLARAV